MKPRVYIETSVVSYLTAPPSRDVVAAAHQQVTIEWWAKRGPEFELFTSDLVVQEASAGNAELAKRRLHVLKRIPVLLVDEAAGNLAKSLIGPGLLPVRAAADSVHIAVAAAHGLDYLLTWNCRHIANAVLRPRISGHLLGRGFQPPTICTPEELLEDQGDENGPDPG